ncbi:arsenate reductase ArsC [Bacteroides faecalis]|nr:arsenate reductase ArsC [Bacteroides faecalis]
MRILILCTGNRCRSQMAQGILKQLQPSFEVHSAGVRPASEIHPLAVQVMHEIGIDISGHYPKQVDHYLNESWDYVITVCGGARETCPIFNGEVKHKLHIGFDDPDAFVGTQEEIISEFRRVRDEIREKLQKFIQKLDE